jgi:hypothetical protein
MPAADKLSAYLRSLHTHLPLTYVALSIYSRTLGTQTLLSSRGVSPYSPSPAQVVPAYSVVRQMAEVLSEDADDKTMRLSSSTSLPQDLTTLVHEVGSALRTYSWHAMTRGVPSTKSLLPMLFARTFKPDVPSTVLPCACDDESKHRCCSNEAATQLHHVDTSCPSCCIEQRGSLALCTACSGGILRCRSWKSSAIRASSPGAIIGT